MSQDMIPSRVLQIVAVFDELDSLVKTEPALAPFASATATLASIGSDVRNGLQVDVTVT